MKKRKYSELAEVWFDQHYSPLTFTNRLMSFLFGIDTRKSVLINFGAYLEQLKD